MELTHSTISLNILHILYVMAVLHMKLHVKTKTLQKIIFSLFFQKKIDAILLSAIESKNNEIVSGVLSRKDIVISKETIEKGLEIAHKKEKEISESLDHTKKLYSGCFVPLYGNNDESYRLDKQKTKKNITECLTKQKLKMLL